ncbi:hypothetical protein ACLOJK_017606 [Asimina triloba]
MADAAVSILFEKLSALLIQEASLHCGIRNEVEEIKLELDSMRAFLRDADRRKDSHEGVRAWVRQVRDAAHSVEDIIDEFLYHIDSRPRGGFMGFLQNAIFFPKKVLYRRRLASLLQDTKGKIRSISERRIRYGINQIEGGTSNSYDAGEEWQRDVETSLSTRDDDIVGMQGEIACIVQWLVEGEPRRVVIAVTGMGGLGKTTLVTKAYDNQQVRKHFDCCACVSVSQIMNVEELLRSIIKQLHEAKKEVAPGEIATMGAGELRRMVKRYLQSKKYVVLLDDVWSINDWDKLSSVFPDCSCGSRLMVTTRDAGVASALGEGTNRVCKLQPLNEEEAWELFCRKAFWNESCPSELRPLARTLVEKCEGLPLAIVALGGLMSTKGRSLHEWRGVYNKLSWELSNNDMLKNMYSILLLSFYHLPFYLKHCFMYCSMFPEDYPIRRKRLMRLWVAEGFVQERGRMTMEDVAEDYLKELIQRSMLQVMTTNECGRVKACRVHDLMREVALSLSNEGNFSMRYDGQEARHLAKVRRISVQHNGETVQKNIKGLSHLRSLFVFEKKIPFSSSLCAMASSFRLLKVLNLEGVPIESVPDELAALFGLRYLNLRRTKVRVLPKYIERLQNLQTLDVRHTKIERLPRGVVKLKKLRHLFIYKINDERMWKFDYISSIQVPERICNITGLQSLAFVSAEEGEMVKRIGNLSQLRRLGVLRVRSSDGPELCTSIAKMNQLVRLGVEAVSKDEPLKLESLSPHPPPLLQKLGLNGHLEKVPGWFGSLTNLTHLCLGWSKLRTDDLLPCLGALPNLVFLQLIKAYEGQQLWFLGGWFPKLKKLYIWDSTRLARIMIEEGAMPSIQEMNLARCEQMKTLPQGLEYLTGLHLLSFDEMPLELVERLRIKDGNEEDLRKVRHIPVIRHEFWKEERWLELD